MIKKIIDRYQDDYTEYNLSKIFVYILILAVVLSAIYLAYALISGFAFKDIVGSLIAPVLLIILGTISLHFVKVGKRKFVADGLFTLFIVSQIISMIVANPKDPEYLIIFVNDQIFIFLTLVLEAFLGSLLFFYINLGLSVVGILAIFLVDRQVLSGQTLQFYDFVTVNFVLVMLILAVLLVLLLKVFHNSIAQLEKEKENRELQYEHLKFIIDKLRLTIDNLVKESSRLQELALNLLDRSKEQATTAEEVAASTEEITTTVEGTVKMTENTQQLYTKTAEKIAQDVKMLNSTIESFMDIISTAQIIKKFAERTDILAINAAIEAAHAKKYGSGFAVIAAEIKKLSELSSQATEKINMLSEQSQEKSDRSKRELEQILDEIRAILQHLENISISAQEELIALRQISQLIVKLSNFAEENSSVADELVNSSLRLTEYADSLKNLIKR